MYVDSLVVFELLLCQICRAEVGGRGSRTGASKTNGNNIFEAASQRTWGLMRKKDDCLLKLVN